jgi:outer membrane lipoprotein-sorting protein
MSYKAQRSTSFSCRVDTTIHAGLRNFVAEANMHKSGRITRIDYLSGPAAGASIIDNGRSIMRFVPAEKSVNVAAATRREDLPLMLSNYKPQAAGRGTVDDRSCFIVRLNPIHEGNPWKRLWIDKSSHITLRTDSYDSDGRLTSSTELRSITFGPQDKGLFAMPKGWKIRQVSSRAMSFSLLPVSSKAGFKPVRPDYIPKGYRFAGYGLAKPCSSMECITLRYTNGLNSITLMESNGKCMKMKPRSKSGCMVSKNRHVKIVQRHVGGLSTVLISDIDKDELSSMAKSLK